MPSTRRNSGRQATAPPIPAATRAARPGWRDPRIVVGVLIVAACVLAGARLMAAADDTVGVWVAARDLPAGTEIEAGDLHVRQLHFADDADADRYFVAADGRPETGTLTSAVGAGELLARSALRVGEGHGGLVEVPLSVLPDDLPGTVREGSVVDVWVNADPGSGKAGAPARLAFDDVVVVDLPAQGDSLAPQTSRQVIIGVPEDEAASLPGALGQAVDGRIVITRESGQ